MSPSLLGQKLLLARKATGLSTRKVAALLAPTTPITHATLANYEKGKTLPPMALLAALADLYARPLTWFLQPTPTLSGIRYRAHSSKLTIADKHRYEGHCLRWLDAYIRLEQALSRPLRAELPLSQIPTNLSPKKLAAHLRSALDLGNGPIPSVVTLLERVGIRTLEVETALPVWALAATLDSTPVVALNPNASADRCRLTAAHELGHLLLGHCSPTAAPLSEKDLEAAAYEFASCLLIPPAELEKACRPKSAVALCQYKEQFGISMAAMIYAARRENILSEAITKRLWIEFAKRGWKEKEPGTVRADRALRFEQLLDAALFNHHLSLPEASKITAIPQPELRARLDSALGPPNPTPLFPQEPTEEDHPQHTNVTSTDNDPPAPYPFRLTSV
jgi:Zn-dependent peptidase ImmA (M78 family)/transcriptional regulator with XRE-family HTH domain